MKPLYPLLTALALGGCTSEAGKHLDAIYERQRIADSIAHAALVRGDLETYRRFDSVAEAAHGLALKTRYE